MTRTTFPFRRSFRTALALWAPLACLLATPVLAESITIVQPTAANHRHEKNNGRVLATLDPDPVEFLDAVSQTAIDELADPTDNDFSAFTFDYTSKWRNTADGTLTIDTYKARTPTISSAGAEFTARYEADSDAGLNLRWVQLVDPIQPFDPDALYSSLTGIPGANGPIPPADGVFIDPYPNDGTDGGPFYWHGDEIDDYVNGSNDFGDFDLAFRDFPKRSLNQYGLNPNGMHFELYLVEYDSVDATVFFLDGLSWGFTGVLVPEPSTFVLLAVGLGALLAVRGRRAKAGDRAV